MKYLLALGFVIFACVFSSFTFACGGDSGTCGTCGPYTCGVTCDSGCDNCPRNNNNCDSCAGGCDPCAGSYDECDSCYYDGAWSNQYAYGHHRGCDCDCTDNGWRYNDCIDKCTFCEAFGNIGAR